MPVPVSARTGNRPMIAPAHLSRSRHSHFQTRSPAGKYILKSFFRTIDRLVAGLDVRSVLDVGCGEALLLESLEPRLSGKRCCAFDLDPSFVTAAVGHVRFAQFQVGSAYAIPYVGGSFDLVMCTEVLEHLEKPEVALRELHRVSARYGLFSVPREPLWRVLNLARGAYWKDLGNPPEHINHWGSRQFQDFVAPYFTPIRTFRPVPWTVVLCEKR